MDVTPLIAKGLHSIRRYGAGKFVLNDLEIAGNIVLLPHHAESWDGKLGAWEDLFRGVEILLLGSGTVALPAPEIREWCKAMGIGLEVMSTGAACRTYNVLLAEGRKVAALLVAV